MNRFVAFFIMAVFFGMTSLVNAAEKKVIVGFKKGISASLADKKHKFNQFGGHIKRSHSTINSISGNILEEQIAKLLKDPDVAYVEADILVGITEPEVNPSVPSQEYLDSWGVTRIGGDTAVAAGITGAGIKVAVLDSGIDYTHPELFENYKGGYNFVYENNDPYDDGYISHGTHIAGIIGARNNGTGVVGVAPEVSLYAVKVLGGMVMGDLSDILAGIDWAITNKMDVINLSIGAPIDSAAFKDACDMAYQAGIVMVAASGNTNTGLVEFPAAYDTVIAVSATNQDDTRASFSNYGQKVELAAPGVNIKSTFRGGGYGILRGTSQATAHITGTAALVLAKMKADGVIVANVVDAVRSLLDTSALDLGEAGRDPYFGFGLVDLSKALMPQPVTYHYTLTKTLGSRKDNALVVELKPGAYIVEITNRDNINIKVNVFDTNGVKEINYNDKHNQRHENHLKKYQKMDNQNHDDTTSFQVVIGASGSIAFIPSGKSGSSADILITSSIL